MPAYADNPTVVLAAAMSPPLVPVAPESPVITDAAMVRADMQVRGWDVRRGPGGEEAAQRRLLLAHGLAFSRDRERPEPRDEADAERVLGRLEAAGWDVGPMPGGPAL